MVVIDMPIMLTQLYGADLIELERFVAMAWGGGNGIIRNDGDDGLVTAQSPLSLRILA